MIFAYKAPMGQLSQGRPVSVKLAGWHIHIEIQAEHINPIIQLTLLSLLQKRAGSSGNISVSWIEFKETVLHTSHFPQGG